MTIQSLSYIVAVAEAGSITLGILYLCGRNEAFLRKTMDEMGLRFQELFTAAPHAFLRYAEGLRRSIVWNERFLGKISF